MPGKIPDNAGQIAPYISRSSAPAAGISEAGFLQRFFLGLPEVHPSLIADKVDLETGMGFSSDVSTNLRTSYNCSSCHDRLTGALMLAGATRNSVRLVAIACVLLSAPCAAGSTALCDQSISHELRIHGVLLPDTPASPAVRRAVCAASGVEQAQIGDPDATISEMMGRYETLKESIAMSRPIRYGADRQIALEAIQYSLYPKLDTARYWYLRTQTDHLALVDLGAQTSTFHDPDVIPDAGQMSRGLYGLTTFRIRRRDYTNHDGSVTFTDAAVSPEVLNFYSEEKQGRVGRDHLLSEGRICMNLAEQRLQRQCPDALGPPQQSLPLYTGLSGLLYVPATVLGVETLAMFDPGALFTSIRGDLCPVDGQEPTFHIDGSGGI